MKSIIFIALAMSVFDHPFQNDQKWKIYKDKFDKSYLNKHEEIFRYKNFKANDDKIKAHNEKFYKGEETYKMKHNQFSDMDFYEFSKTYLHPVLADQSISYSSIDTSSLAVKDPPESLSYQKYCMPPLDQGKCGSCWAFSSAGQVEAQLKIKDPNFNTYISPQYILDCTGKGNCTGGNPNDALAFLKDNGLVSLKEYPYIAKQQSCNKKVHKMTQKVTSNHLAVLNMDEDLLKKTLSSVGPVVIVMTVTQSFYKYESGIYHDKSCPNGCEIEELNHAVLLVGYGTDKKANNMDYWLIKNSWGGSWGEAGYVRMIRGSKKFGNNCNVACYAFYGKV